MPAITHSTHSTLSAQLSRAHDDLLAALIDGETAALRRLVAADCQIIGPKGYRIGRQEWIETHSSQVYQQVRLDLVESEVQLHGDVAIRCDLQRSECLYQGETISGLFRVLNVWTRQQGQWQLDAIQYTAVSPEADTSADTS